MSSEQAELHSSFYQTSAQFHSHFIFYCKYLTWHELAVIGFTNKNLNMDVCQKSDFFFIPNIRGFVLHGLIDSCILFPGSKMKFLHKKNWGDDLIFQVSASRRLPFSYFVLF